ncbi:MAG: LTA synthase family protein [Clostridia bacterium]|nr:LTA synthase family protein [Clostridia bacterium]
MNDKKAASARSAFRQTVLRLMALALTLNFAIEWLSRHKFVSAFLFAVTRPHAFLYNSLIIACTLGVALLFRRKTFAVVLTSTVWLILGLINCIMHIVRITPLGFYDFVIWARNTSISNAYVTIGQFILIGVGVVLLTVAMVVVYRRAPTWRPMRRRGLLFVLCLWALTLGCTVPYAEYCRDYADPAKAYRSYGFPYSLLRSAVDRGISKPQNYDRATISGILPEPSVSPAPSAQKRPNFIFLQLESFLAPDNITSVQLSENPVPTFTALRENCSSGYLYVPMIGGGTANVEFEVVTGMKLSDFGTGEYPYSTIMQEAVCESMAFNLRELGYRAHAIHSNTATFYQRHLVFPRLGFDTFTSLEYMRDYTVNSLGWCRDECLITPILQALALDSEPNLVFTVSVQGHGMYSADAPETPYAITSTGLEDDPGLKNAFEYYVSQLKETDDFLSDLMTELKAYPEPVVLVVYGDHLPAYEIPEENLRSGSLLATEYVIWTNDGSLEKSDADLTSYQLAAYTLGRFGIGNGVLMRFHQQRWQDENYLEDLHNLEYDMLYGDQYLYEGQPPYAPTDMRMGVTEIRADSADYTGKALIVRCEGFTPASIVCLDDDALDTVYVDSGTLVALPGLLDKISEKEGAVSVAQIASDGTVLSRVGSLPCTLK